MEKADGEIQIGHEIGHAASGIIFQRRSKSLNQASLSPFTSTTYSWCPEGDLNPHGLAACGF